MRAGNLDMRKYPWWLADGDIIGVRIERENTEKDDDFQCDADFEAKADFNLKRDKKLQEQA